MFEYFVRVLYRLALLSDHLAVFLCAHLPLYLDTLCLARTVDLYRCFSDASGDVIVLVERWHAAVFKPGYLARESKDAECGELKGIRL